MDSLICWWIMDFLLRQSVDDRTLDALLRVLPLPTNIPNFKRSILLRKIESEVSKGSVSEKILELLEIIEELDRQEGIEVSEAMKSAYCAVAVDCTVRFLKGNEDDKAGKYFEAVKRIWRCKIRVMERSKKSELVSEQLRSWKDDIEAVIWDTSGYEGLLKRNEETDALEAVHVFAAEAKDRMTPSFLELAANAACNDDEVMELLGLGKCSMCDQAGKELNSLPNVGPDLLVNNSSKDSCKGNLPPRRKHVAKKRPEGVISGISRGVKITDTEECGVGTSYNGRYDCPATPEVNKVQEALKTSSLELQAAVQDPLPDALQLAESLMSDMERGSRDKEQSVEDSSRSGVDAANYSADNSGKPVEGNKNLGNQPSNDQATVPQTSFMARNSTARTFEWDDSIDTSSDKSPDQQGAIHLPSPKRRLVSPLKKYEMKKLAGRRLPKKWSVLEEDTLRTGVQKYGKGNWKLILKMYSDIFEERTEVDLKDKWRNMIRY